MASGGDRLAGPRGGGAQAGGGHGRKTGEPGYLSALLGAATGVTEGTARRVRAPYRPAWRPDVEPLTGQATGPGATGEPPGGRRPGRGAPAWPGQAPADQRFDAAGRAPGPGWASRPARPLTSDDVAPEVGRTPERPAVPGSPRASGFSAVTARPPSPVPSSPPIWPAAEPPGPAHPADGAGSVPPRSRPDARPVTTAGPPPGPMPAITLAGRSADAGDPDRDRTSERHPAPSATAVLPERQPNAAAELLSAGRQASAGRADVARAPAVQIGVVEVRVLTPAPAAPAAAPPTRTAAEAAGGLNRPVRFFGLAQG